MSAPLDVVVVGGGLAGVAFAAIAKQLLPGRLRIAVLEQTIPTHPASGDPVGLRVLAIAPAARAMLEGIGAWASIPPERVSPYERMHVWHGDAGPGGPASVSFDAADIGLPALGYIVEHDWIRAALWSDLDEVIEGVPSALHPAADRVEIALRDGRTLQARLVVAADGSDSWVRSELRLPVRTRLYGQSAIIAHVRSERPHQSAAWQRFTPCGPVALLPLADGRSSIVWSCSDDEADALLAADESAFEGRLTQATSGVLGALALTTPRVSFPLASRQVRRYTGPRFALIGDAAHQVHPLAGQGINLGFQDADALARALATHLVKSRLADPGDIRPLRDYERMRKGPNMLAAGLVDGLHALFSRGSPLVAAAAGTGLGIVDRMPPIKRMFARQATGQKGGHADHDR